MVALFARVSAQSLPIDTSLASRYFDETRILCSQDNGKLWGVSLCGPLLLADHQTRTVVANQADGVGILTRQGDVFVGLLPESEGIANTATDWAGVRWTMIMFPLPEDKYRRARLIAHELWHRIQDSIGLPSIGAANKHLDLREGRFWLQLEWRALAAALTGQGGDRRQAIADALLFRYHRRSLFPHAASEERVMEMHEGLAEYTGVKLCGAPDLNRFVVDENLNKAPQKETFVRSFAYASGPAYGMLLDETGANWRKDLRKEDDLGTLLQNELSITLPQEDINRAADARARSYDGDKLQASEGERENKRREILAGYRARLVDGPVLSIPLQKMSMEFNPYNPLPLDSIGTVYPDLRVVDVWGILTVSGGGALMNPTFSRIEVPAPDSPGASPIRGKGWTLQLNEGWTAMPGERKGDFVVRKRE
jgi:hypothetical protein